MVSEIGVLGNTHLDSQEYVSLNWKLDQAEVWILNTRREVEGLKGRF